jgi:hypothetical protein
MQKRRPRCAACAGCRKSRGYRPSRRALDARFAPRAPISLPFPFWRLKSREQAVGVLNSRVRFVPGHFDEPIDVTDARNPRPSLATSDPNTWDGARGASGRRRRVAPRTRVMRAAERTSSPSPCTFPPTQAPDARGGRSGTRQGPPFPPGFVAAPSFWKTKSAARMRPPGRRDPTATSAGSGPGRRS